MKFSAQSAQGKMAVYSDSIFTQLAKLIRTFWKRDMATSRDPCILIILAGIFWISCYGTIHISSKPSSLVLPFLRRCLLNRITPTKKQRKGFNFDHVLHPRGHWIERFRSPFSGMNILVSAFTITVIAIDRWKSVSNTNPTDNLSYKSVFMVIGCLWMLAFVGESSSINVLIQWGPIIRYHLEWTLKWSL